MELHVIINGRKDLAEQLYQQLHEAIVSGRPATGCTEGEVNCFIECP